jgi:TPR repeat protein
MLLWSEVAPLICIPMDAVDHAMVLSADAGEAAAQCDVGQLFSNAGKHDIALYWIRKAAEQEYPDAMQWLGRCYLSGDGIAKDDNLGIMWIAKAAAFGHSIAREQMKWFTSQLAKSG